MRLIILYLISSILTISQSSAQLSLDIYTKQVLEYSLTLKAAQNRTQQSEESVAYTKTLLLPELLVTGSYRHYLQGIDGQKPWSLAFEPQIVQTIYGGGVIRAEVDKAKLSNKIALCNEEFTLLEVGYAAEYAYWNYWATNRHYLTMCEYVRIIAEQREKIKRRYSEGYTSKGDLLMIQSQLSEAEYQLISIKKSRLESLHNLNMLRGVSPSDSVTMAKFDMGEYSLPVRLPLDQVVNQRSDYDALLLNEKIASIQTKSVRGGYNPTLQGGIAGGVRSSIPNISGDTYWDGAIYLSLSIPIYRFGERRKAVAISRSNERMAKLDSDQLFDNIVTEESNAWTAVAESWSQMGVATKSLKIASENLEISTYSYSEGLVSILDLMQSQISWIQIYTNAINSQYNYLLALAYYKKSTGSIK